MAKKNEFAPCQLLEHEDGTFSLLFTDFDTTADTFEELDQEGGGYGWHGVVDALVRMRAPKLKKKLSYDPEASMFVALSKDKDALRQVAELIASAVADPELLKEAITKADPDLMD
ncbi:immunity 51 family protein [Frigoriglobus tundricola]|uniref:Immunity protein 51 n=1 Tax=Frigoriglobus tundricola TaxID=2774151 RepID=A0A6M5YY16_9BACT|nr:immunity 51 family protein [Frigoriglobus tundricola]QJW98093.1 hypothetical protein FTUN_5673 [Frigoriglobus tundricola]